MKDVHVFNLLIYIGVVQGEEVKKLLIGNKDDQAHKVMDPEAAREFAKYHQLLFMMDPEAAREFAKYHQMLFMEVRCLPKSEL